ncbi:MAG: hypothetical protein ACK5KL_02145 [Dysgonomonas sp.]
MSIFTILVIIFIIVPIIKSIFKHFNEQKPHATGYNWGKLYSARLRSILSSYNNFRDEEIIDSAIGFYLFSYNDDTNEFIFIQEEDIAIINHFTYMQLISYNIRNTRDYNIIIDLKTTVPNKTHISIECFNREIALKKIPYLTSSPSEFDNLYQIEKEKVEEVEYILQEILEKRSNTEQPPVYKEEVPIYTIPIPVDNEVQVIDVKEEIIPTEIEEDVPVLGELVTEEEEVLDETPYYETSQLEELVTNQSDKEEKIPVTEESSGEIEVSLTDIDDYSRGKFLDWEILSAVGDAKIKGQKSIYLSAEQLEKLKS